MAPDTKTTNGTSRWRKALVAALVIAPQLWSMATQTDHWPFGHYAMYSQPPASMNAARLVVVDEAGKSTLYRPSSRYDASRLSRVLERHWPATPSAERAFVAGHVAAAAAQAGVRADRVRVERVSAVVEAGQTQWYVLSRRAAGVTNEAPR